MTLKTIHKYILVSFEGRDGDIVPFGLQGRDIIDLSKNGEEERLFRKLQGQAEFEFSPVAPNKPNLSPKSPQPFMLGDKPQLLILNLTAKQQGSSLIGGLYKHVDFDFWFEIKNDSTIALGEFAYEVRVSKFLDSEFYMKYVDGDEIIYSETVTQKIFPNQVKRSKVFKLKVTDDNIGRIVNSQIVIKVFCDFGEFQTAKLLAEVLKIRPNYYGPGSVMLSRGLFR